MKQKTTKPKKVFTQSEVDKVNYFFKKAFDFGKEKKYAKAVEYYDKVLSLAPEHFIAWYNKANDLAQLNKYEEAITCYSEAIKLHPTDSSYWTNKGLVLLLQREYTKAVACFDESLKLNPLNKTAKKYRESAKEKQGEVFCLT